MGKPDAAAAPDSVEALLVVASGLQARGDPTAALAVFRRAVALAPDNVEALTGEGECSLALGAFDDARDSFETALAHEPQAVRALCGIGRLLREAGDAAGAVARLREAAETVAHPDVYFELGLACNRLEDTAEALAAYRRALEIDPTHHGAQVNLGLVYLSQLGEPQRARECFEAAVAAHPASVAAQANLGLALEEAGEADAALAHYERLIARDPAVVEYRWNRGLALLRTGEFARGWEDYELRHVRGGRDVRRDFGLTEWEGRDATRHHLLVYGEQGVGDEIMFASCLPALAETAAGVVLECEARLAPLFARSFPQLTVHGAARDGGREWLRRYPALDRQVAIGSLPRFLRRRREDFPAHGGYLVPEPARLAAWRARLAEGGRVPVVGLAWRGGTRKTRGVLRSLELADLLPLAAARRCRFICLQRGDCSEELAAARAAGVVVESWPQALDDLEETAALIGALDAVVSVDSTVAHLAGALGCPGAVLLARVPDWRYGTAGERMPWYPSLRLLRQTRSGEWAPVVAAAAAALPG